MPPSALQQLELALAQHRSGNLAGAEQTYRQVVAEHPQSADGWHLWGALCLQSGRANEAVEKLERAIALDASNPEFFNHLGAAYGTLQQHDAAIAALRRAVRLAPQAASSHYNLGTALRNAERLDEAVASFRHAIAANPSAPEAHYNLANTLRDLGRIQEPEAAYRQALELKPNYLKAIINLANLLRENSRAAEAVELLHQAVALAPVYANAHLNLGTALRDAGRHVEALDALRHAVTLDPRGAEAHNNLGTVLQALARFAEARKCYQRALELDPSLADAHFSRATDLLRQGNLAEGFAEYEWRWKCKSFSRRTFAQPSWDGSPLLGRSILLHAEQGLGDTLQFVRFAESVQAAGGRVTLECHPPLVPLLKSCRGIDRVVAMGQPLPPCDVRAPLMSLAGLLRLGLDELWSGPYLAAEPRRVAAWRERLAACAGLRVGVCWQGNRQHLFDAQRSFPLGCLAPLVKINGVRLISLQKGDGCEQIAGCGFEVLDLGDELDADGAFLDTAAVIENLDLVICSDTAVAHLAGGLGAKTWLALSAHSDWRWLDDRSDSPWYPTMRLFRQGRLDEWREVFDNMAGQLRALAQRGIAGGNL